MRYKYLEKVNTPGDLKKLNFGQMQVLAEEIRDFLVESVSKTGGHLASNLGTVELTLAMHKVFDCPKDQLVWDVGHQAYTHKILTGRRDRFSTLRQENGLSGFPRESESEYDSFVTGHAGTSLSVACGLATAKELRHDDSYVLAVIGDGALTCGQAYEALNNAGRRKSNLIVIVNDNGMSISRNVGALAKYMTAMRNKQGYFDLKDGISHFLDVLPLVGQPIKKVLTDTKQHMKNAIYNSNIFEAFGFVYLGPTDGHDLPQLCRVLQRAKKLKKPCVVHVNTIKGKGYPYAENDPCGYHGVPSFNVHDGKNQEHNDSFTDAFSHELMRLAEKDERICTVTAAMCSSTGLEPFSKSFPNRFFDVGIAEEHAVTFSSALAKNGMIPVCALYSTFLQRGYDQLLHDVCIENRHVVFAVDRAGVVGEDGVTHQGIFDAAFLSQMPHMTVYSPYTYEELRSCLYRAIYETEGPVAVRYPRGAQTVTESSAQTSWVYLRRPSDTLLVTYGRLSGEADAAAEKLQCSVMKPVCIQPLDPECIREAATYSYVFFAEEGIRRGGIGEEFFAQLNNYGFKGIFRLRGVEDFVEHATVSQSLKKLGLDRESLIQWILEEKK
ncbi:MAG TPA: 1-deoxy-D-xylulose-5-phosphate synthase [Ruminococcaceae bacterium]|nr:1-deoxy-D-xylulose-5-phosphate synthase [Oscillospiraceae bacterium]